MSQVVSVKMDWCLTLVVNVCLNFFVHVRIPTNQSISLLSPAAESIKIVTNVTVNWVTLTVSKNHAQQTVLGHHGAVGVFVLVNRGD